MSGTGELRYFPRRELALREVQPGARMWSVALEKTQFTYFEVDAGTRFETHSHPSEQITMVLEGELYFETEAGTTCVGAGEVMAVPSGVPHAVYTRELPARAVDAWSPVMPGYE